MLDKTAAPRAIYYHGTSRKNTDAILKQGLNPNPKERVWHSDPDASMGRPSRESYGGVYVTQNLMTAYGAPKDKNEQDGLTFVILELQPNSLFLDEDDVVFDVTNAIQHLSDNEYHVLANYLAASHERVPEEWKQSVETLKKEFIDKTIQQWKFRFTERGMEMHDDLEKRLREMLPQIWFASLERLAAHAAKNTDDFYLMRAYGQVFEEGYDYEKVKAAIRQVFPTVEQAEKHFQQIVEPLTRTLRVLTRSTQNNFNPTARITEPVGYSGANKITGIVELRQPQSGFSSQFDPYRMIVRYGTIPPDFIKQWETRMGGTYQISKELPSNKTANDGDIPNPLRVTPSRPDVIEDWRYLPNTEREQMIKDAEIITVDPDELLTNQATLSKHDLDRFAQNPQDINKAWGGLTGEHQPHPLILHTNEGMYIFDGNHRCAAAKINHMQIKVLYLDLRPMQELMGKTSSAAGKLYHGNESGTLVPRPGRPLYFSETPEYAARYGKVTEVTLAPGAKILDGRTPEGKPVVEKLVADYEAGIKVEVNPFDHNLPLYSSAAEVEHYAKQLGYDGVVFSELNSFGGNGFRSVAIWNPAVIQVASPKTAAYTAYVLTDASRQLLLEKFPPKFTDVIAHHVTMQFGVAPDTPAPEPAKIEVVGYAADESLEAAVVAVNGETERPDGSAYHITLSLDRSKGRKPVDSNKVVAKGWEDVVPAFELQTVAQKLAAGAKPLHKLLESLRPQLVEQAQNIYDGWADEWAGLCRSFAAAFVELILTKNPALGGTVVGANDHSWAVVANKEQAFKIDIPWKRYERRRTPDEGGGWKRLQDIVFDANDIIIEPTAMPDWYADEPEDQAPKLAAGENRSVEGVFPAAYKPLPELGYEPYDPEHYHPVVTTLRIDALHPTQPKLEPGQSHNVDRPTIVKHEEDFYILDGHHKIAEAIARGETTIDVDLLGASPEKTASKSGASFEHGHCWEWALAYQEINGGELYAVVGYHEEDNEEVPEYAHAFVSKDGGKIGRDARGSRPVQKIIEECHFDHPVKRAVAERMNREDFEQFFPDPQAIAEAKKTIPKTADTYNNEGFWAGEGNAASGILPVCPSKGTVCLAWRSDDVHVGNCWGTIGGAIQKNLSPSDSAKKELMEETGYSGGMTLTPAYVFASEGGFQYHNFIGVVSAEFGFHPQSGAHWETDHIVWMPYHDVLQDMQKNPADYHPGLVKLFHKSKDKIEQVLQINKTSAQHDPNLIAYMNDLWAQTYENPFNRRERVWQDKVAIECDPFNNRIHLSLIRTLDPKKGYGTEGMQFLVELADKHGVAMELEAHRPNGMKGPSQAKLIQWYKRFGFQKGRQEQAATNVANNYLIREPKQGAKTAARIAGDTAIWLKENKPFVVGAVNLLDGEIEETHNYVEMERGDWHHTFAFSPETLELERDPNNPEGNLLIFWIDPDGSVASHEDIPPGIVGAIKRQIKPIKTAAKKSGGIEPVYHGTTKYNWKHGGGWADRFYLTNKLHEAKSFAIEALAGNEQMDKPPRENAAMVMATTMATVLALANQHGWKLLPDVGRVPESANWKDSLQSMGSCCIEGDVTPLKRRMKCTATVSADAAYHSGLWKWRPKQAAEKNPASEHPFWFQPNPGISKKEAAGLKPMPPQIATFFSAGATAALQKYYHVSPTANRKAIRKRGLIPQVKEFRDIDRPAGIYVFKTSAEATNWAYRRWHNYSECDRGLDLWEVLADPTQALLDEHPEAEGALYITGTVPPGRLKLESYLSETEGEQEPSAMDGHREDDDIEYLDHPKTSNDGTDRWKDEDGAFPPTPDNIQKAKNFLRKKRAQELGHEAPADLSGACKFASLFAQAVFGGELEGNWNHQYVRLGGQVIDLTDGGETTHDPEFWGNPEHTDSMKSCKPRVENWVREFLGTKTASEWPQYVNKTAAKTDQPSGLQYGKKRMKFVNERLFVCECGNSFDNEYGEMSEHPGFTLVNRHGEHVSDQPFGLSDNDDNENTFLKCRKCGTTYERFSHDGKNLWEVQLTPQQQLFASTAHYYHGSKKKFDPGFILTPQAEGYIHGDDPMIRQTEQIVEQNRPKGALPRAQSVFMVGHPDEVDYAGGYEDYVYEVEPIGRVEKNDMGWYSDVSVYYWDKLDDPDAVKAANNYWAGKYYGKSGLWEYRAPQARVIRLHSSTAESTKTGATGEGKQSNLLYHGTSRIQFERMKADAFQVEALYLGEDTENICAHYAEKQAEKDNSDPVILTVDANRLPGLKQDVHQFSTSEEEVQLGQYIFTGDLRPALVKAEVMDEHGNFVPLFVAQPKQAAAEPVMLYHGTSQAAYDQIMSEGGVMKAPSWWGTEEVATYYYLPLPELGYEPFVPDNFRPVTTVLPIKILHPTQKELEPGRSCNEDKPTVLLHRGEYYILDGHHKIAEAVDGGAIEIEVDLLTEPENIRVQSMDKQAATTLVSRLESLRPALARAAQQVYNNADAALEFNGICAEVAMAMRRVVNDQKWPWVKTQSNKDEVHTWLEVTAGEESYRVDIPFTFYEEETGYSGWQLKENVSFQPHWLRIKPLDDPYWGSDFESEYDPNKTAAKPIADPEILIKNDGHEEAGEDYRIISLPLSAFNPETLIPDQNSIAEPLTHTLGRSEDDLFAEWEASTQTWQDCLRIYGSIRYEAPITITTAKIAKVARPTDQKITLLKQQYKFDGLMIEQIIQTDPTEKDYVAWIGKWIAKGGIKLPEDAAKIKQQLTTFNKLKRSPKFQGNKDIGPYTPAQLYEALEQNAKDVSNKEQKRENVRSGATIIVDTGEYRVYRIDPSDREDEAIAALVELSGGTNWCTAQPGMAKNYLSEGPSYIMFYKNSAYAQLHPASDQYMDRTDEPLTASIMSRDPQRNEMTHHLMLIDPVATEFVKLTAAVAPDVAKWYEHTDPNNIPVEHIRTLRDRVAWALATGNRLNQPDEADMWGQVTVGPNLVINYIATFIRQRVPAFESRLYTWGRSMSSLNDYCEKVSGRLPEFEEAINQQSSLDDTPLHQLVRYCENTLKGRWAKVETFIWQALGGSGRMHDEGEQAAAEYARYVLKGPWTTIGTVGQEIEDELVEYPNENTVDYAAVRGGRWPELEELMLAGGDKRYLGKSPEVKKQRQPLWNLCADYAVKILQGRWVELEKAMLEPAEVNPWIWSFAHPPADAIAKYVAGALKARWPHFEYLMVDSGRVTAEPGVATGTAYLHTLEMYVEALHKLKLNWPNGEKEIARLRNYHETERNRVKYVEIRDPLR